MSKRKENNEYYEEKDYTEGLVLQYLELAMNRWEWKGLPKEMPMYVPENWLTLQGMAVAFKLPETDVLAILPVAYGSVKLDVYGNPKEWRAFAVGTSIEAQIIRETVLDDTNSVLIWNNGSRTPDVTYIRTMCRKIVALDKTLDINVCMQRTPILYKTATKQQQLSIENVLKDYLSGKQIIVTENGTNILNGVEAINLGIQFIGDKLSDQYETYHNRILRYLGIDFLPVQKQERMLTGEVDGNNNETVIRREIGLKYRKDAAKKINEMFGLNVTVDFKDVVIDEGADSSELSGAQDVNGEGRDDGEGPRESSN